MSARSFVAAPVAARRLDALEVAAQLPVRDATVRLEPLLLGHVEEVVVDLLAERLTGHLAAPPQLDGVDERRRPLARYARGSVANASDEKR